jgi:uncharacterized protein
MHYYIDGYNMLFRLHAGDHLQSQREMIIQDLNQKIELVKIDVTLVFDSAFQIGDRSRSHFKHLEILFTAEGETADEFIIDELKRCLKPRQEIVVTSDKRLAWRARRRLAQTETVEGFLAWLNRCYKNKLRLPNAKPPLPSQPSKPLLRKTESPSSPPSFVPSKDSSVEECLAYYEQVFEQEFQELRQQEIETKARTAPPPKKKKKQQDPFEPSPTPEEKAANEQERWRKIFEKRLNQSDQ